jgi:hypothetical protein
MDISVYVDESTFVPWFGTAKFLIIGLSACRVQTGRRPPKLPKGANGNVVAWQRDGCLVYLGLVTLSSDGAALSIRDPPRQRLCFR